MLLAKISAAVIASEGHKRLDATCIALHHAWFLRERAEGNLISVYNSQTIIRIAILILSASGKS